VQRNHNLLLPAELLRLFLLQASRAAMNREHR
jgi:hypothetical protein